MASCPKCGAEHWHVVSCVSTETNLQSSSRVDVNQASQPFRQWLTINIEKALQETSRRYANSPSSGFAKELPHAAPLASKSPIFICSRPNSALDEPGTVARSDAVEVRVEAPVRLHLSLRWLDSTTPPTCNCGTQIPHLVRNASHRSSNIQRHAHSQAYARAAQQAPCSVHAQNGHPHTQDIPR
jgi:hypothetical protein